MLHAFAPRSASASDYTPVERRAASILRQNSDTFNAGMPEKVTETCVDEADPLLRIHLTDISHCPDLYPVFQASPSICSLELQFRTSVSSYEDMCNRGLNSRDARMLVNCFRISQCLIQLRLRNNNVTDEIITALFPGLFCCMQLVELDLSFNKISDQGAKLLSNMLRSEYCLTDLDLSHNDISSDGCKRISTRLQDTSSLQNLNLSVNRINDSGAIDLLKALSTNQTVLNIALSSNQITHTSFASLTNLIQQNHTIILVDLSGNEFRRPINDGDFSLFLDSIESNPNKPQIDLRGCGLTASQKTVLDNLLHANTPNCDTSTILPSKLFSLPPQLVG